MMYKTYLVNADGSKTFLQCYPIEDNTYEQVLAIVQGLDQSQTYSIEYWDGSTARILM